MPKVNIDSDSIWKEFQAQGLDYQSKMGFDVAYPLYTRFVEGKQWPAATDKTKNMPRPVINQCDFIIENKKSNILSQTLKIVFSPEEMPEGEDNEQLIQESQHFTDAIATMDEDIDQEELDEEMVNDTLILGTGIIHYYHDNGYKGGKNTPYVGKVCGDIIDPIDIVLGNPHLPASKIQNQPWIIIRTYPNTENLKVKAKANGIDETLIQSDNSGTFDAKYDSQQVNLNKPNTTTLLTKYYKQDGQVMWMESTKYTTITEEKPLSPDGSKPFELYPIDMLVFKKRRKCCFGRSIIEDIIPNQKSLNFGIGMMLLSIQQTAWPKILAKVGALNQQLTNIPGEIIEDHSLSPGVDGIKYMQPPNFSSTPMIIGEKLLDMTRQVTGTTEVNSGEILGANMAASAIIALQNQAQKPNQLYQKMFARSKKRQGRIKEEFVKTFYSLPRPIYGKDENGLKVTRKFTGTDHANSNFKLKLDIGTASEYSESLQMSVIQGMYDKKDITKYQFVKYSPKNLVTTEMREDFEREEKQLEEQQQQQMQIQQNAENIHAQLTPEEQAMVQQDPTLVNKAMMSLQQGGM